MKRIIDYTKGETVEALTKEGWISGKISHFVSGDVPMAVVKSDNHPTYMYVYCVDPSCIRNKENTDE